MNLRIDLILESEQRSATTLNLKLVGRVLLFALPTLLGLIILAATFSLIRLKGQLRDAEAQWLVDEPRMKAVQEIRKQANANLAILQELESWKNSHVDWGNQLRGIQEVFPATLQLTTLTLADSIDPKIQPPTCNALITLRGKAFDTNADRDVQRLRRALQRTVFFTNLVTDAEVRQFEWDPANRNNRLFQIAILYKPRAFQ